MTNDQYIQLIRFQAEIDEKIKENDLEKYRKKLKEEHNLKSDIYFTYIKHNKMIVKNQTNKKI